MAKDEDELYYDVTEDTEELTYDPSKPPHLPKHRIVPDWNNPDFRARPFHYICATIKPLNWHDGQCDPYHFIHVMTRYINALCADIRNIQGDTNALKNSWPDYIRRIIDTHVWELHHKIDELIEEAVNDLQDEFGSLSDDLKSAIDEWEKEVQADLDEWEANLKAEWDSFQEDIVNSIDEFEKSVNEAISEFESKIEAEWSEYQDKIDKEITDFEEDMDKKFGDLTGELETKISEWETSAMETLTQYIDNRADKIQDYLERYCKDTIDTLAEELKADIEQWKEDTLAQLYEDVYTKEESDDRYSNSGYGTNILRGTLDCIVPDLTTVYYDWTNGYWGNATPASYGNVSAVELELNGGNPCPNSAVQKGFRVTDIYSANDYNLCQGFVPLCGGHTYTLSMWVLSDNDQNVTMGVDLEKTLGHDLKEPIAVVNRDVKAGEWTYIEGSFTAQDNDAEYSRYHVHIGLHTNATVAGIMLELGNRASNWDANWWDNVNDSEKEISVDLSDYYTKEEVNDKINDSEIKVYSYKLIDYINPFTYQEDNSTAILHYAFQKKYINDDMNIPDDIDVDMNKIIVLPQIRIEQGNKDEYMTKINPIFTTYYNPNDDEIVVTCTYNGTVIDELVIDWYFMVTLIYII